MIWSSRRSLQNRQTSSRQKGFATLVSLASVLFDNKKKKLFQMNQVEEKEPTEEKLITELIKSDDPVIRVELKV